MYSSQSRLSSQTKNTRAPLLFYLCLAVIHIHGASAKLFLQKKWEVTQVKRDRLSYAWNLGEVIPYDEESDICVKSHEFSSTQNSHQKWILEVCSPMPRKSNDIVTIQPGFPRFKYGISLIYLSGEPRTIDANYTLTVINGTYDEIHTGNGSIELQQGQNGYLYEYYDFGENSLNLPNITNLIISVEASLAYTSIRNFSSTECSVTSPTARSELQSKYNNPDYETLKGIKITTESGRRGGRVVTSLDSIHELNRSWYKKLYVHSHRHGYLGFDFEVVNETLHFLYHGKVPQMERMAREFFKIAKEIELEDLEKLAEEELCNGLTLNLDDIVSSLIFAHEEKVTSVKSRIINYIASQPENILKIPRLIQLKESHPYLMQDILNARSEIAIE